MYIHMWVCLYVCMYVPTYICDFCVWTHGSTHNNTTKYILSSFCRGEVESVVWTVCHWQSLSVAKSAFKVCLSNHKAYVLKQCILDVKLPESIWKSSEYGYILEMTPLGTANKIFWAESLEGTEIKDSFFSEVWGKVFVFLAYKEHIATGDKDEYVCWGRWKRSVVGWKVLVPQNTTTWWAECGWRKNVDQGLSTFH